LCHEPKRFYPDMRVVILQTPLLLPEDFGHGLDRKAATLVKRDG
jgi:hypothetical protein